MITDALKRITPKLSVREAARRAGISEGWWRQIANGCVPMHGQYVKVHGPAGTVARMAKVVGLVPDDLARAGRQDAAQELRNLLAVPVDGPDTPELLAMANEDLDAVEEELDRRLRQARRDPAQMAKVNAYLRRLQESDDGDDAG